MKRTWHLPKVMSDVTSTCRKLSKVQRKSTMTKTEKKKLVTYWYHSSLEDWKAYLALRKARRYAQALFFLHLALEKLIKALIVSNSDDHAPMSHNLSYLVGKTTLQVSEQYLKYLSEISRFNMSSRYPDEKLAFYSSIDKKISAHWHKIGLELKRWLENLLNVN